MAYFENFDTRSEFAEPQKLDNDDIYLFHLSNGDEQGFSSMKLTSIR